MCDNCECKNDEARLIEVILKENEFFRKEIQMLHEEIDLVRMRIPDCPCGNTMVSTTSYGDK